MKHLPPEVIDNVVAGIEAAGEAGITITCSTKCAELIQSFECIACDDNYDCGLECYSKCPFATKNITFKIID